MCIVMFGMLENPERSGTERNGTEPEVIDAQCNTDVDAGHMARNWR